MKQRKGRALGVIGVVLVLVGFAWGEVSMAAETLVFGRPAVGPGLLAVHHGGSAASFLNLGQVYDTLFQYNEKTKQVEPFLVKSYEVNSDFTVWTFRLREGVKFHDGTELDANAVKFTLDRMVTIGEAVTSKWPAIGKTATVEVLDKYRVRIKLRDAFPIFPIELTYNCYGIISPTYVKKNSTPNDPLAHQYQLRTGSGVGTGPFRFSEFKPEEHLVLEKFNEYWGGVEGIKSKAKVDRLVMRVIPDASTRKLMLERGDVDIAEKLPSDMLNELQSKPKIKIENYFIQQVVLIVLNSKKPYFKNEKVRQAVAYGIDYDNIIKNIENGRVLRLHGFTPEGMVGYNTNRFTYQRNIEMAKGLLREAGYPNGFKTKLMWATERRPEFDNVAPVIQSNLAEIGITLELEKLPFGTLLERTAAYNHEMSLMTNVIGIGDPESYFDSFLPEGYPNYKGAWSFTFTDAPTTLLNLMQEGRGYGDPQKRGALYGRVDDIVTKLAAAIPLYQFPESFAMRDNITGLVFDQKRRGTFYNVVKTK